MQVSVLEPASHIVVPNLNGLQWVYLAAQLAPAEASTCQGQWVFAAQIAEAGQGVGGVGGGRKAQCSQLTVDR